MIGIPLLQLSTEYLGTRDAGRLLSKAIVLLIGLPRMYDQFAFSITTTNTVSMCRGPGASGTGGRLPSTASALLARIVMPAAVRTVTMTRAAIRILKDMERVSRAPRAGSSPSDQEGPSEDEATSFSDQPRLQSASWTARWGRPFRIGDASWASWS